MTWFVKMIDPRWRFSIGVLLLAVLVSLIYGESWRFDLPLALRNASGLVLFSCIMFGAGVAYAGARLNGAMPWQATKIALLLPVIWHLKEIWLVIEIYGVGPGIYAGLQGFYPFYYGLIFVVMGVAHLACELYRKVTDSGGPALWCCGGYFFLPLLVVAGLEALGLLLLGTDAFFFEGYLAGYRALFM